jgi:predicted ATPase/DNA-binding CsgD family transcriptional regulator
MHDGAWLVDLSVIRERDAVALAISDGLGIVHQERPAIDVLADHLAARQALILVDNCEHVLAGVAATVNRLLDACPDVRILATSRVALRVQGESIFVVPPFAVPDSASATDDLPGLASVPSVELFVERARAADPSFRLSSSTAPAIASICRRVDGLPLAIELAGAQAGVLTPVEIDERLGSIGGLGGGARSGPARQRTMEATLDWSHDLLGPLEQAVYRRLAVFAGGWTLDAAEQVCAFEDDRSKVVAALATLVDHSLVVRDGDAERSRYRMLVPIAEDASRRLAASTELGQAGLAHAMYYLAITTRKDERFGENLPEDLDRVAPEYENCMAALRFAEQSGILPLRLGLIRNLMSFWRVRGHLRWGSRRMEAARDAVTPGSYEHALLLGVLADFGQLLGEYDKAEARAREAEAMLAALGNLIGQRTAIGELGVIAAARGDFETALEEYRRARPLVDALPDDNVLAYWHAGVGRFELALGDLAAAERDLELARDHFSRSPSWSEGWVLAKLGVIAGRRGDATRSAALFEDALRHMRRYGSRVEAIGCLEDIARIAIGQRDWRRAATLLAASTRLRDATAAVPNARERADLDADIDRVRSMLEAPVFDEAWGRGLGLTLDEAAEFATAASEKVALAPPAPRGSALTPRELEIADLVALGLSNREIAERLVIAPGTVRIHVERILGKLGRTSRVQVATWVVDERSREGAVATRTH